MKHSETLNKARSPFLVGRHTRPISSVLVVAMLAAALPSPASAAFQDKSGSLPGFASKGALIGAGIGAGVLVGLLIYYKLHHKQVVKLTVDHAATKFDDVQQGQPVNKTVSITNSMSTRVDIKSITVEDPSGDFALTNAPSFPYPLAPGTSFAIPLTVSAKRSGGSAHIRVIASNPDLGKDGVENFQVSYGHQKSKLKKLIP